MSDREQLTTVNSSLEIRPLTAAIGAEIGGVHLKDGIPEAAANEIRQALDDYRVIFFRDQHLDDEAQLELARVFGEPEVHPIRRAMGNFETLSDIVDTPDSTPDRRTTQHFGVADHKGSNRVLRRCTVEGERPIAAGGGQ